MKGPAITHPGPACGKLAYTVGKLYLKVAGWTVEGELPDSPKGILIAAPHTTNWDLPHMLAVAWVFRMKLNWVGKHTIFKGAAGPFMRWLGGLPVDRRARHGAVDQVAAKFAERDGMFVAIAPAGTRGRSECWKSGFYYIAAKAQVPIMCGFLDFRRKVGGVGATIMPTGDVRADMDKIRAFYENIDGKYPELHTPIYLKDEALADNTSSDEPVPSSAPVVNEQLSAAKLNGKRDPAAASAFAQAPAE